MVGPLVRRRLSSRPDQVHEPPCGDAPDVMASDLFVFETEWATYYLHPGSHSEDAQVSASVLNDMDAIVVERSQEQYEDCSFDDLAASRQYTDLIPTLIETPRPCPIYSLDLPIESMPTTEGEATNFLRWFQVQAVLVFGSRASSHCCSQCGFHSPFHSFSRSWLRQSFQDSFFAVPNSS